MFYVDLMGLGLLSLILYILAGIGTMIENDRDK